VLLSDAVSVPAAPDALCGYHAVSMDEVIES